MPGPALVHLHVNAVRFVNAKVQSFPNTHASPFPATELAAILSGTAGAAAPGAANNILAQPSATPLAGRSANDNSTNVEQNIEDLKQQQTAAKRLLDSGDAAYADAVQFGDRLVLPDRYTDQDADKVRAAQTTLARTKARLQYVVDQVGPLLDPAKGSIDVISSQCTPPPVAEGGLHIPHVNVASIPLPNPSAGSAAPSGISSFELGLRCVSQQIVGLKDAAKFQTEIDKLYQVVGVGVDDPVKTNSPENLVDRYLRESVYLARLTALASEAPPDLYQEFEKTSKVVCGPAATTYFVNFAATDIYQPPDTSGLKTANSSPSPTPAKSAPPATQYESPTTVVECGPALAYSLGIGASTMRNRTPSIVDAKPAVGPSPGASPTSVKRFGYVPNDPTTVLPGWFGVNTRIRESTDSSAYYLSLSVKPSFKQFEAFFGPSLLLNKSLFITPGWHIAPLNTLGGGWNDGELVPASITTAPTTSTYVARFGIMLSFPVTGIKFPSGAAATPKPSATPEANASPKATALP